MMAAARRTRCRAEDLLLLLATCVLTTPASAEINPDELADLLAEGRADEAYELASEHRGELEGEILFDFYYGVAAIESGRLSEGVFALERVVMRRPGFAQARLQLGRGYFLLGEDRRAEEHFDAVMAQDPPEPVVAAVERFRAGIRRRAERYRTVVTGYLAGGLGSDSNVNSATDADTVDTILGSVTLDPAGRERDDSFVRLAGGVELKRPLSAGVSGFLGAEFDSETHPDEDEFDTRRLNGRAGAVFHGERLQTTVSARVQRFYLDDDEYQDLLGLGVNVLYRLSGRTALFGGLQVSELDNRVVDTLDSTLTLLSTGVTRVWPGRLRPAASLSVFAGEEDADEDTQAARAQAERDLYGVGGQLRLQFTPDWQGRAQVQFRRSDYGAENPVLGKTREEDYYRLHLALDWMPDPHWQIGPQLSVSENDANTELHEYDRTIFEVRARYNFF